MKKLISSIIGMIVAFCVLFVCGACNGSYRGGVYVYENADKYTAGGATLTEPVTNLSVNWISGAVNILYHEKDAVEFSEESKEKLTEDTTVYYYYESGALSIKFAKNGYVSLIPPQKTLTVYLPQGTVLDKLEADTVSARVTATGLSVKNADIDTVSGSVELTDLDKTETFEADTVSGDLKASFLNELNRADIDAVSGKIEISAKKITDFECDSTSGNIILSSSVAPSCVDIDTVSGEVVLYLPSDLNATVDFDTLSGDFSSDIDCSIKGKYTAIFGNGANAYSVESTSGALQIKKR